MKSGLNVNYLDKEIFGEIWTIGFKKHITFTEKIKQLNYVKLIETKKKNFSHGGSPCLTRIMGLEKNHVMQKLRFGTVGGPPLAGT